MFATIRKAVMAALPSSKSVAEKSGDTMLETLTETETRLKGQVWDKHCEMIELEEFRDGFTERIEMVDRLIASTDEVAVIAELQSLRRAAKKLESSYAMAYINVKEAHDSLNETLSEVQTAKNGLVALKETGELDDAMRVFDSIAFIPHTEVMNEADKREIALTVHTANALVGIKAGSR